MTITLNKEHLADYAHVELGQSDWLQIDQTRVNAFADATLDHQFIHVDEERAKEGPFGTTIAHGFLSLSLLPHFVDQITHQLFLIPSIQSLKSFVRALFNALDQLLICQLIRYRLRKRQKDTSVQ